MRSSAMAPRSIRSSRPASSGGGMPAPGANGLRRGSIYRKFIPYYRRDINWDKLPIIQATERDRQAPNYNDWARTIDGRESGRRTPMLATKGPGISGVRQ